MNNPASHNRTLYIELRNCRTGTTPLLLAKLSQRLYNGYVHIFSLYARSVFIFRPARAAWYLKVASCYWKCEQSSRPFSLEIKYD
jgi:hypothetical protein